MKNDPKAQAALDRLGPTVVLATHLYCLTNAVRALLSTHQAPEQARAVFDQLFAQQLAHQGTLDDPDQGIVLRDFAATLFQPPVKLDT